ncbi:uncharacterized protein LOC130665426 [Microplitis mediator]|uniref:uncharacterized protein LOC130665426 n=1 Tax=Microplitis mediator TaxID=375433 RepID=UPI002557C1BC|nr:uncharacterized protein LOC130665426 [Microplitis mediator]
MADFDKDFDFDEDSLREIESNEESLLFSQRDNIPIESPNENQSPPRNPEISSRKNLLLDIFESNKSVSDENISQDESSSRKNILLDLMSRSSPEPSPESPKERHPLRRILIDSFSKNTSRESTPDKFKKKLGFDRNSASPFKRPTSPPKHVPPPKTLVRKFPGPAGLLSYSKSRSKNTSHRTTEVDFGETKRDSGFCSQETKKLFTDGAWRQMIDELPDDYLRGQNISSIKRPGRSNKIPVLAGIIHRIDWSADNPRVTLKDISDSVEGIMHKDIFTTYPNILQPGVVVLLRNVGILNVTGSKTPLTTSIVIISTDSIIAAYNDKSRIITTPELTKLINRDYADSNQHDNYDDTENIDAIIDSDFEFDNHLIDDLTVEKTPALTYRAEGDNDLVREEVNSVVNRNEIAGSTFGDDLLNDSDDELMSQMDLDIADKSPDNRDTDQGNEPAADRDNFFELNNDDTFGDSDDEMLSQFDVDAVVKTYDAT